MSISDHYGRERRMDDAVIFKALRNDLDKIYSETSSLVERIRGLAVQHPRLVHFFDRVMEFYVQTEIENGTSAADAETKNHAKSSLLSFFGRAFSYPNLHEFIVKLVWFLAEISAGNTSFEVEWINDNREDGVALIIEEAEFEGSSPKVCLGGGLGVEDVEKLHKALDRLIEQEREYVVSRENLG